jgi:SAM-dependent methyltransferase
MDARYWERVAARYEQKIFASSRADTSGVIRRRLDELADPRAVAADFGCGVGHYLPLLARRFRSVHGVDFADSLLEQARERCARLPNVRLHRADLSSGRARIDMPRARVGVCANVLISRSPDVRQGILRTLRRHLAPGARLLLVVPSLESALFANQRLVEWNERLGFSEAEALASGLSASRDLLRGLVPLDRVPTKHFLREEILVLLARYGFAVSSCDKVEYAWDTEFEKPPAWMAKPGPWDWLLVARRRRGG